MYRRQACRRPCYVITSHWSQAAGCQRPSDTKPRKYQNLSGGTQRTAGRSEPHPGPRLILARPGGSFRKRNRRGVVFLHHGSHAHWSVCYNGPNALRRSVVWKQQNGRRQGWIRASVRQCYDSILQEPEPVATVASSQHHLWEYACSSRASRMASRTSCLPSSVQRSHHVQKQGEGGIPYTSRWRSVISWMVIGSPGFALPRLGADPLAPTATVVPVVGQA